MAECEPVPEDWSRGLAIVAHSDDLEFGCASAIARWVQQGKQVSYLLVSRGETGIDALPPDQAGPLREEEQRKSAHVVGVETVEFLSYPDGAIEYNLQLRRDIAHAIRRHKPDVLIGVNHQALWEEGVSNHPDHRHVGLAMIDAARDSGNRWLFQEDLSEGLDPWGGVKMVLMNHSPQSTHVVNITNALELGIASLREHHAYLENLGVDFDAEVFLRSHARANGERCGFEYAEVFEIIFL